MQIGNNQKLKPTRYGPPLQTRGSKDDNNPVRCHNGKRQIQRIRRLGLDGRLKRQRLPPTTQLQTRTTAKPVRIQTRFHQLATAFTSFPQEMFKNKPQNCFGPIKRPKENGEVLWENQ